MLTAEELIAFEADIAAEFNAGKIRSPIHLDGGNEEQLIGIFRNVSPNDWVCGSWRMHYKCLLHGIPRDILKRDIIAGHSITLCYPERRIISSAIVGGILPIALGIAWSIKRAGGKNRVWAFIGDMTAETGMAWECNNYARLSVLPINFVVENNGLSVCTPTEKAWGINKDTSSHIEGYDYKLPWPHSGAGKRVNF
jgi:TPP-dependent pyruvate/acetoin dehydrogenase alpha subunit